MRLAQHKSTTPKASKGRISNLPNGKIRDGCYEADEATKG